MRSLTAAIHGILHAVRTERNMRIHLTVALLVIVMGIYQRLVPWKWAILILVIGLVLALEMVNTAIENTVNLICAEYHPTAKKAKDIAAGAVLLAAAISVVLGVLIFFF